MPLLHRPGRPFRVASFGLACTLVVTLLGTTAASAQTGSIAGVLVDAQTGEALIGATALVEGTTLGASADLDGRFEIKGVAAGTYTVVFSYIGYQTTTVRGVAVEAGAATVLDVSLTTGAVGLDEVVVEAAALRDSDAALLRERQRASAVSDAISAETISRSGAGDASAAMAKVTGASVVDGRYVYIRGLGERYSTTQLNGAELPSADPDKKAFQLDLFPASLLDHIVTLKTFTPDKPGNFSGGLINVGTKSFPERFTAQVSFSSSYNTQTTFTSDLLTYASAGTNWLGFAAGSHDLPDLLSNPAYAVPTSPAFEVEARSDAAKAAVLDAVSEAFNPIMFPSTREAPVGRNLSVAVGNQFDLGGRALGFTASLTYSQNYTSYEDGLVGRYELVGGQVADVEALAPLRLFGGTRGQDVRGTQEADLGGMATLSFRPHPNHELSSTFLQTRSGASSARYLTGFWQDLSENSLFQTRVLGYKERDLRSLQLRGEHVVRGITLTWTGSAARNTQDEPDLRYFSNHVTYRDLDEDGRVDTLYQRPASLYPAPLRIFRDLAEQNLNVGADLSIPFSAWSGLASKVKVGGSYLGVDRDFNERRFEYREGRGVSYTAFHGDEAAYFSQTGIVEESATGRYTFGNYIIETSPLKNNYTGEQTVAAGYAMLDLGVTKALRVIGGARFETTQMETVSADTSLPAGVLDDRDWLPSVNAVYAVGENMNVRAAYTRTLARPTFRELAPYSTFDFVGDFVFEGNSGLRRTLISNYDLRWEWFVRRGEILAVSAFYKGFRNPIERVILTSVGNNTLSVQNVDQAIVYGLELEARKRLDDVAPFLKHMAIGGNFSFVQSRVDIPEEEMGVILEADPGAETSRSLQGQSPYLVNLDVSYDNPRIGTVVGVYYNVFGSRLATVSEGAAPDVFERARTTLDLVVSQRMIGGLTAKLSAKNVFDDPILFSQRFKGQEFVYSEYHLGRTFSFGVSYSID